MKKPFLNLIASAAVFATNPVFSMELDSQWEKKNTLCIHVNEEIDIDKACQTPIITISLNELDVELWAHKDIWNHIATLLHPRDVSAFQQTGKLVAFAFPKMLETSIRTKIQIDPIKLKINFTQNAPLEELCFYYWRALPKKTVGYEDQSAQQGILNFSKSQEYPYAKIELELYDTTSNNLSKILPLCKNVVGLKLTNSECWPAVEEGCLSPDDSFLEAITTCKPLATLEYLHIKECEKITNKGALYIVKSQSVLPNLKKIHSKSSIEPKFYTIISKERPDLKLTYEKKDDMKVVAWYEQAAQRGSAEVLNSLGAIYWEGQKIKQNDVNLVLEFIEKIEEDEMPKLDMEDSEDSLYG